MSKVVNRLLTFSVGLPLVILVVCFTPLHHILLHITILAFSCLASCEIYNLLAKNLPMQKKSIVVGLSMLIPLATYVCALLKLNFVLSTLFFIASFMVLLVMEVFYPNPKNPVDPFADSNKKLAGSLFVLVYGGYLISFVSRMTVLEHSTEFIVLFLVMIFLCDSAAWFFGVLFGKGSRGYVKASPNKSIVGFVGGILASIASGILCTFIWPQVFTGPLWRIVLLGLVVSISAILGDLAESVFKRSAKEKDSGNLIPGRGGALDSIDSVLMAAPLFYFIATMLFTDL